MAKILVTGGAGFIGSNLVDQLIKLKHKVIVIDNLSLGKKDYLNPRAKFYKLDVRNLNKIKPIFNGIDFVFHLAAQPRIQPSIIDPIYSIENNIIGTLNVLLASKKAKVKRVIYSASSSVYGNQDSLPLNEEMKPNPKNPYALGKLFGEYLCKIFSDLYDLDTVCLRYFNVYGPRQSSEGAYATVIGIFLRQLKNKEPLTIVGDGNQRRDFTYIDDVVRANILAMESKKKFYGEVINIGCGKNYSINELAKKIIGKKELKKYVVYLPPRPGEARVTLADNKKAFKLLGWKPKISLSKGIEKLKKFN